MSIRVCDLSGDRRPVKKRSYMRTEKKENEKNLKMEPSCDFGGGDERNEAELREIAALQQEIAEQEALLDEHSSKLVKD